MRGADQLNPAQERSMQEHTSKTIRVPCPCCQGETRLIAMDTDQPGGDLVLQCLHCDDGTIASELDKLVIENHFVVTVDPALKRNTMTPNEKREHLRSLGVKDNADIEKIISEIYP